MRGRGWLGSLAIVGLVALIGGAQLTDTTPASHLKTKLDRLRDRLDDAREQVREVQGEARTVSDQIESIDAQSAAVQSALDASKALIERLERDVAELQRKVDRQVEIVDRTGKLEKELAVSLYKSGGLADLQVMLDTDSVADVQHVMELADTVQGHRVQVMIDAERARAELRADQAKLEDKLTEARAAQAEQRSHAQHLRELRAAKTKSLAQLRKEITEERDEIDAIEERSSEVEDLLAEEAARARARAEAREAREEAAADAIPTVDPGPAPGPPSASGFIWPWRGAVTSGFGWRWGRMHEGIDIDCAGGETIRASRAGRVLDASYDDGGYGYHVVIAHRSPFGTLYAHASALYVSAGETVSQGEAIMACGSTGASTGAHLHFEIRVNGVPQDPLNYLP